MVVCLSTGKNSGAIIQRLKSTLDYVDFHTYATVSELIKDATLRHIDFKRIIISNNILEDVEEDLSKLNDFIKNYSSNTEVILMLNKNDDSYIHAEEYFNQIFNSPMYTPVNPEKPTFKTVKEIVASDVVEVQLKYYVKETTESSNSKNLEETSKLSSSEANSESNSINQGEFGINNSVQISANEYGEVTTDSRETSGNENSVKLDTSLNSNFISNGSPSLGEVSGELEDFDFNDEDLSLGEFGSSHSDTGFLDDEDEEKDEELQNFIKEQRELKEKKVVSDKPAKLEFSKREVHEVETENKQVAVQDKSNVNIDLMLSLREANNTQELIDYIMSLVDNGHSVLLIDADYKSNRVLSFIDSAKFYSQGCEKGIYRRKVYTEDGVGVISNGYGYKLETRDLVELINSSIVSRYDMVYIDCPLDCLSSLDYSLLRRLNIILNPGKNLTDFLSTSKLLTSRENVSLESERYIMSNCLLDLNISESVKEDLRLSRNITLFINGNWMDRVGL